MPLERSDGCEKKKWAKEEFEQISAKCLGRAGLLMRWKGAILPTFALSLCRNRKVGMAGRQSADDARFCFFQELWQFVELTFGLALEFEVEKRQIDSFVLTTSCKVYGFIIWPGCCIFGQVLKAGGMKVLPTPISKQLRSFSLWLSDRIYDDDEPNGAKSSPYAQSWRQAGSRSAKKEEKGSKFINQLQAKRERSQ